MAVPQLLQAVAGKVAPLEAERSRTTKAPQCGAFECAEEDSNLHPLSVDQALNLVTRVSDTSYASIASRSSGNLDVTDVLDDLDVATDVATAAAAFRREERYLATIEELSRELWSRWTERRETAQLSYRCRRIRAT
jgi:hypothetical protein